MARIRTVKPEMAQDEDLAECSIEAQLLAVRILNHSDDEGYFKANINLIKANCFPLLNLSSVKIQGMLTELSKAGYLRLFSGADGKEYGHVRNFSKHQNINRPTKSKIAEQDVNIPNENNGLNCGSDSSVNGNEDSLNNHGGLISGKEWKGKEQGKELSSEPSASEPAVMTFPTNKFNSEGETYPVSQKQIDSWQELFPAIDVAQGVRDCLAWNRANPAKRKTYAGIEKHIVGWLTKNQNNPPRQRPAQIYQHPTAAPRPTPTKNLRDVMEQQEAMSE